MKILFLLITFTSILFSFDENPEYFKIEGEFTMSINQTIDLVRVEATDKAIKNAIASYILHDEIPQESRASIIDCLQSKLVEISVIDESVIQTKFTITIKAYIAEISVGECL